MINAEQLLKILPGASSVADVSVPALNTAMAAYAINTPQRIAAFLAQLGHESGQLLHLHENLNYGAEGLIKTWPKRFNAALAGQVARNPEAIANIVYADRLGNGPQASGDGWKYCGRGYLQVTGKSNYQACGEALKLDLVNQPELLEQAPGAALSAGWFWSVHNLNGYADKGDIQNIGSIINVGSPGHTPIGAAERLQFYQAALKVLG